MPRDFRVYLDDILEATGRIREYTHQCMRDAFLADTKTQDAVIRNLEIIGEAVRHVPKEARASCDDIDWRKVIGMRDVLIHQYFSVDAEIVWDIVTN